MVVTHYLTHAFTAFGGFAVGLIFTGSPSVAPCPACVVTCGSLSCPAVTCSTGNFYGSWIALAIAGFLVLLGFGFWVFRGVAKLAPASGPSKGVIVDGRKGLGPASSWKPLAG